MVRDGCLHDLYHSIRFLIGIRIAPQLNRCYGTLMHWFDSEVSQFLSLECFRLLNAQYGSSLWFIFCGTASIASSFCCSALIQFVFDDAHQAIAAVPTALHFSMGVLIIDLTPVFVDSVWSTMEEHGSQGELDRPSFKPGWRESLYLQPSIKM